MKINWISIGFAAGILFFGGFILGLFFPYVKKHEAKFSYPEIFIIEHELYRNRFENIFNGRRYFEILQVIQQNLPYGNPCSGNNISSFGWRSSPFGNWRDFHSGIDIAAPMGTPIRATAPGRVLFAGWWGGYGYTILIQHRYGIETLYAHCSYLAVIPGTALIRGQIIGYVGKTGNSTGPHCHYEIRLTTPINPDDIGAIF